MFVMGGFMLKIILKITLSVTVALLLIAATSAAISHYVPKFLPDDILSDDLASVKQEDQNRTVILDAGHGGEDPGAVGIGGIEEKTINLSLTKKIEKLLEFDGYNVIMTREEDELLYNSQSSGSRKAQDLRNRLAYQNDYPDATFVSIHMNKFPLESCHGLQVYYSGNNEKSMALAEVVRDTARAMLQPDNKREIKKSDSSIFILDNIRIPAVLIECGFISNPEEAALLASDNYQYRLAEVIATSIADYYSLAASKET